MLVRSRRHVARESIPTTALHALALSDTQLGVIRDVAMQVPPHLRPTYLDRLAQALRGLELGDPAVHRAAFSIRESLTGGRLWNAGGGEVEDR
jgi:hypothetical protein